MPSRVDASRVIPEVNASWLKKILWVLLLVWSSWRDDQSDTGI